MPLALPPSTPVAAYIAPAPECRYLSDEEAQVALSRIRRVLPSTRFDSAAPSEICGLVMLKMASGKVVYTEPTGRYLLLTFALDTHRGSPADNADKLEQAIETRSKYPDKPVEGVLLPPPEPVSGPLMSVAPLSK